MLVLISPAKSLDFDAKPVTKVKTQPDFIDDSAALMGELQGLSAKQLGELMGLSKNLGELNYQRNQSWQLPFTPDNAKQAVLAFQGDVYQGLEAASFSSQDFKYAQKHLRILSGLYGLLRPLDLIQPYRLEMGTKFVNSRGKNLYEFWGDKLTAEINQLFKKNKYHALINLASNEYFKSVKPKLLNADIITPQFKDYKNGQYKMISFYAKKARGMMAAYIIKNQVNDIATLKKFNVAGYKFSKQDSSDKELVFLRKQ